MNLRTVYLWLRIAALALGLFFMGSRLAHAEYFSYANGNPGTTSAQAFAACHLSIDGGTETPPAYGCGDLGPQHCSGCSYPAPAAPAKPDLGCYYAHTSAGVTGYCWVEAAPEATPESCAAETGSISYPASPPPPPAVCSEGCTYAASSDGALCDVLGQNCHFEYTTQGAADYHALAPDDPRFQPTCTSGETPGSTEGDADGDGVPDADDADTNDSDSDGTTDANDPHPNDPTDANDSTGNESDNTSHGGGSCSSPPVSDGDGIAAQTAYQTWATRCEVEKLNREGVKVKGTAVVVGVVGGGTNLGEDEDPDFGNVTSGIPGEGVGPGDAFGDPSVETGIADGFDDSGFLTGARACPLQSIAPIVMPEFMGGAVIDFSDKWENLCTILAYGALFIQLMAALASIKIYSKVFS